MSTEIYVIGIGGFALGLAVSITVGIFKLGEWKGRVDASLGTLKGSVDTNLKTLQEFRKEIRDDIKRIIDDIKRIFERLPDPPISGSSPARLTGLGKKYPMRSKAESGQENRRTGWSRLFGERSLMKFTRFVTIL